MSEDTTQQLLAAQVDRLISMTEETHARLQNVETGLQNVEENQGALKAQFQALEDKVEQRLYDTRPIWESVQARLDDLDARSARLESGLSEHRSETATGFRGIDRKIGVLSKNLVDMTAEIRDVQDRMEKLESHPV
jgi:predicted  nucleic acid-binding Zn-ribbon protein